MKLPRLAAESKWQIRRATEGDLPAIESFQEAVHRPKRSDSVTSEYLIAESSGRIVACAAVRASGQFGYLYGLAVDKAWRRQGIGHMLTQRRLDWLVGLGIESAFVFAMFWNIRFFKRHGFKLAERKKIAEHVSLHRDFAENWNSRSALLEADLFALAKHSSLRSL